MKLISYSARQIDAVTGFIILGSASGVGRSASGVAYVPTPLFMSQEIFRTIGHETAKSTVDGMLKVESCTNEYPDRMWNMFASWRERIEREVYCSVLLLMCPHYTQRMLTVCVRIFWLVPKGVNEIGWMNMQTDERTDEQMNGWVSGWMTN
jgi:hypothetical protein